MRPWFAKRYWSMLLLKYLMGLLRIFDADRSYRDPSLAKRIQHLRITMPKRFRTWSMKYDFAPESFSVSSAYGIDLDIFQHFKIGRYSLRRLYVRDAMNVDKHMYKYIAQTFPFLEELTIESPVSFHSQWNCDGL